MNDLIDKFNKLEIKTKKGAKCSKNGNKYEQDIYNIVKFTTLNNKPFNTQKIEDLGGSKSCNDLECNFEKEKDIGIEIKKAKTPDWMQCSLKKINNIWSGSEKGKIPLKSREIFNKILEKIKLFDGETPPFLQKKMKYAEWCEIKEKNNIYNDVYINIPDNIINKLYLEKGCKYIQISDYGLYRLDEDICNFNVPLFRIKQHMRIRIKVHSTGNEKKCCKLSIMASCQPIDIKTLEKSPYTLDDKERLPLNLIYSL